MKILLTTMCLLWANFVYTQTIDNLDQDTVLANQYYSEALTLMGKKDTTQTVDVNLEKALKVYQKHRLWHQVAEVQGLMAYQKIRKQEHETGKLLAEQTIEFVTSKAIDESSLSYVYATLQIYYLNSDNYEAIEFGKKALQMIPKYHEFYFRVIESLIYNYSEINYLEPIEKLLNEVDSLTKNRENEILKRNRFIFFEGNMRYYSAKQNFETAIIYGEKLIREYDNSNKRKLVGIYTNLGQYSVKIGKMEDALNWSLKAVEAYPHKNNPKFGSFLGNLAIIYARKGAFKEAISTFTEAIDLFEQEPNVYLVNLRYCYANLGTVYYQLNDIETGMQYLKEGLKYGDNDPLYQFNIASLYEAVGKRDEALALYQKMLILLTIDFDDNDFLKNPSKHDVFKEVEFIGDILTRKAKILVAKGKITKDQRLLQSGIEALDLAINVRKKLDIKAKGFSEARFSLNKNVLAILNEKMDVLYYLNQLEAEEKRYNEDCFNLSEQRKAMLLVETLTPSPLPKEWFQREKKIIRELELAGQQLEVATKRVLTDSIVFYKDAIFEATQKMEQFSKEVSNRFPNKTEQYNTEYISISAIQEQLNDETILVSYNLTNKNYYAITIGKNHYQIHHLDIQINENDITEIRNILESDFSFQKSKRNRFIDLSHVLYQQLIQPLEDVIADKKQLIILQEKELFSLPFELLLKSNEKKDYHELDYLIKKYNINYHYSATAYHQLQSKKPIQNRSLLAFAPVFEKGGEMSNTTRSLGFVVDSIYRGFDDNSFNSLPNTKVEVKTISKMLNSQAHSTILLGKNATKTNLSKSLVKQPYQFIHIATHGIVNFKQPKLSSLACYSQDDEYASLLYTNEIQNTDIQADLVVLSSCESGIGQLVEGQGLIALNRSFFYAGARNVLFSLWKVDDKWSSQLMIDFYKNYLKGQSYSTALRNAKLELLEQKKTAEPKYWAAFVLMGK